MNRIVQHVRSNAVAYVALFVALGGTSYAAIGLPANSVGSPQIKNHSITPVKLDPRAIGGVVRYWAKISTGGRVIASQPRAQIVAWYSGPPGFYFGGVVRWGKPIPTRCFALVTAESYPAPRSASAVTAPGNGGLGTQVRIALTAPEPVDVAVVCPTS